MIHTTRHSRSTNRGGAVLIAVIVCLTVAGSLSASLLRTLVIERRQMRLAEYQVQAGWLAEAGLERAAARMAAGADYHGETWNLDIDQQRTGDEAVVVIEITELPDNSNRRQIRAIADFPIGSVRRVREVREVSVDIYSNLKQQTSVEENP